MGQLLTSLLLLVVTIWNIRRLRNILELGTVRSRSNIQDVFKIYLLWLLEGLRIRHHLLPSKSSRVRVGWVRGEWRV